MRRTPQQGVQEQISRLAELRSRVDGLNQDILQLLQRRAETILEITVVKADLELEGFDPRREEEMLRSLERDNQGPFGNEAIRAIFGAIFRASLDLQEATGAAADALGGRRKR